MVLDFDGGHDGSFNGKTILSESPSYATTPVTQELLIGYYWQKGKTNLTGTFQKVNKPSEGVSKLFLLMATNKI